MATMTTTTLTAAVGAKDLLIPLAAVTDVVAQGPPLFTETTLFCQREAMTVRTFSGLVVRVARGAMGTQATGHPSGVTVYVGPTTAYGLSQPSGTFSMPQGGYTPLVVVSDGTIWNDVSGSWGQVGGDTGIVDSVFGRTGNVTATNGDYTASQVTNVPAGTVSATTVQAAITELDSEKAAGASSSVDSEIVLFSSTTGKVLKRATGTGYAKITSGVLQSASAVIPASDLAGASATVPATAGTTGTTGQIRFESGFLYVCVATNTWERVAIATWP